MSQTVPSLSELADEVDSREQLVEFITRLHEDFLARPDGFANADLSSYLEAMAAWGQEMDGYYRNRGQDPSKIPPFRMMAHLLLAASIYE